MIAIEKIVNKAPSCTVDQYDEIVEMLTTFDVKKEYVYKSINNVSVVTVQVLENDRAIVTVHPEDKVLLFNKHYMPEAFNYAKHMKKFYYNMR